MAYNKNTPGLEELLLQCLNQPDPLLSMLKWLCSRLMEAEVAGVVGVDPSCASRFFHSTVRTFFYKLVRTFFFDMVRSFFLALV